MNGLQIDVQRDGDRAILILRGRLVQGEHRQPLLERVDSVLRDGCREIVIDLHSISDVDSAGLGELVAMFVRLQREGTHLRVVRMPKRLTDMMSGLSNLRGFFAVEPPPVADPFEPRLRDVCWELWLGAGLTLLMIIGAMIALA